MKTIFRWCHWLGRSCLRPSQCRIAALAKAQTAATEPVAPSYVEACKTMRDAPDALLSRAIGSFIVSQAVFVVAKLGIADELTEGPRSATQLAHLTKAHPRALY